MPIQHVGTSELDPETIRIGATIKAFREARGMTQERLSQAALLSRAYVANVEAGRKKPSMKAVARLADALVVPQISLIRPDQIGDEGPTADPRKRVA